MTIYVSKDENFSSIVLMAEKVPAELFGSADGIEANFTCDVSDASNESEELTERRPLRALASVEKEVVILEVEGLGCQLSFGFDKLKGLIQAAEIAHREASSIIN